MDEQVLLNVLIYLRYIHESPKSVLFENYYYEWSFISIIKKPCLFTLKSSTMETFLLKVSCFN